MKSLTRPVLHCLAILFAFAAVSHAAPIKKEEIDYQNYAFKQWYGTTLVWRYERLPKSGSVAEHRIPYSGAIYLDRQGGTVNAMSKYDHTFNGDVPKATQFERRDIAVRGYTHWAGHCNGWTAAAIRHAEPRQSVTRNGVVFTPSDIKELLAELYVYTDTEFLGGIDMAINPGTLHVILTNWIGLGKHPIGVETTVGREVWNYPGYSYTSESQVLDDRHVEVQLNLAYVDFLPHEIDRAPKNKRSLYFHYVLTLNEDGEITDGTYLYDSNQIDMLWVPMKPTRGGTEGNEDGNPHIDPDIIIGMWRESVPESVRTSWVVVDPVPEDAVLVSDWFRVDPNAEDARLEYIPDLTQEQAENLELAAKAGAETAVTVAVEPVATVELEPVADSITTPLETTAAAESEETADDTDVTTETQPTGADRVIEVFRDRFADGSMKLEREVTLDDKFNYVSHGMYRQWAENGTLIAEGRFEMGRRVGQWNRAYRANESKLFSRTHFKGFREPYLSSATFRDGKLHGTWTIQDSEDRIVSEIVFVDGVRGKLLYFHPSGAKLREVDFRDGVVDGFRRDLNEKGDVVLEQEFRDGHYYSTKVESFVSTTKKSATGLLHPRLKVTSPDDWWNATMAEYDIEEGEPVRHGLQTVWYETGQLRFRGQFDHGKATGKFEWWQENGQVSRQGNYVDDQQQGVWTWWHSDGSKSVLGSYDHGAPVGRWLFWKPGGELDQIKELSAGGQPAPRSEPVNAESLSKPLLPETPSPESSSPANGVEENSA